MVCVIFNLIFYLFAKLIFFAFCLQDCNGFIVYEEQIIAFLISLHKRLFDCARIFLCILVTRNDFPAGFPQLLVNALSCFFFWQHFTSLPP